MKLKEWMFLDNEFTQIEIINPTLGNIELMEKYGLKFVVKGFKSIPEYRKWDRLRIRFGICSTLLMTRFLSKKFISDAIISFIEGRTLPSQNEVSKEMESNRILKIVDDSDERRILERDKYLKKYNKYSVLIRREIYKLIRKGRVEQLSLIN